MAVLLGASSLNEQGVHSKSVEPGTCVPGGKSGFIARLDVLGDAPEDEGLEQPVNDVLRCGPPVGRYCQALSGVLVHYGNNRQDCDILHKK